ncbi:type I-U CRISPR-associated protein Csb2 [Planctellipticum variicoloris]|uniref:type I-G CRISPR-associated protein Csb2 n=1 Tax=Planctellipticum variicoloris TaxID=3064265 RepID=UPI003013DEAC|nr:type I-U CRISPR-associated protein Csb2 [Planctomycetaceae bacterium SH412]
MILLLSVRLLDDRFHGLAANGEQPNWPPSCFRLFQAIVAGNARGDSIPAQVVEALKWLEALPPPVVIVPASKAGMVILTYVLNNAEGRSRTQKFLRPTLLNGDRLIEFAWQYDSSEIMTQNHARVLLDAVRHIRAFGWGIDLAIGHGVIQERLPEPSESRSHFVPREHPDAPGIEIRVPKAGSMESLTTCFRQYLGRFESSDSTLLESGGPVYQPWPYASGVVRPHAVFKLIDDNDDTVAYPHAKLIHVAGMVRHIAIEMMRHNPPRNLRERQPTEWVQAYVAGHQSPEDKAADGPHSQLSYIPLPSIGHQHADPAVRRVMIVAPLGDEAWLDHLAQYLDGQMLEPENDTRLPAGTHLQLIPDGHKDGVRDAYIRDSRTWASFTPVILPGHDDHKPDKTRKLILKALAQSGIEQPCEFEWSTFSLFPKSYDARKYVHDDNAPGGKRRVGYFRPDHLLHQTAVHLRITFQQPVPGPITVGAGRHYGLGLFAATD